ncbi:MAG: SusC/RagA family TonB-linked outer membrane protein [Gemmatimonadetes bacterium]|nr:SusC/RagA family TonB-linked outer membrane protein [Gemmatimonadota bacterium]
MRTHSFGQRWMTLAGLLAAVSTGLGAQGTSGIVNVRVTADGAPVDQAQVVIVGTTLGGITNSTGQFSIRNVPAGAQVVRVIRVGYSEQKKNVTVTAGGTETVEFALTQVAVSLAPVVTTATGEQRRIEIGNATANISAAELTKTAPVASLGDLINSRAAGVQVTTGTQTGTGSRIRVRGMNSISLSNEPIWIIDGVRMTSNNGSFSTANGNGAGAATGGNNASRTGDLNPEEIESIEIVKGPSAATLYGTDAANGVIVVTTKRGRAGAPSWSFYGEGGLITDRNNYPDAVTMFGTRTDGVTPTAPSFCNNQRFGTGLCRVDSIARLNIFDEPDLTPVGTGSRNQFGAQVSGGTEAVRYFISGEREDETGVLDLPEFERERFKRDNLPLHEWTERPNSMRRNSLRANLNTVVNPKLDFGLTSNFIDLRQRYSLESNSTAGLGSHLFGGPGYRANGNVSGPGITTPTPLNGYRAWTPGYMWQEKTQQDVTRFIWSMQGNYRPTSWLQNRATVGQDFTMRNDENLLLRGEGPPLGANTRLGSRGIGRTNLQNITVDAASTATFNPTASLNLKTTAGLQYINYAFEQALTGGSQLAAGSQTVQSGAQPSVTESTTLQKTFGLFVEQTAGLNDRLFLTAAVRSDQNSAFGTDFQRVFYPKFSASWLVSEEGFWKAPDFVTSMRLRFAYGQSGVQPGPNDSRLFYTASTAAIQNAGVVADQPTVVFSSLGNTNLKPERSGEFEGGFETQLFNSRMTVDVTYYNKRTEDALIDRIIPPSFGIVTRQLANLGAVRNSGWELQLGGQLVDRSAFTWDVNVVGSINDNEVLDLGDTPPQIGNATRTVKGYPIGGLWAPPITGWEDKNKDGVLSYFADAARNEVFVDTAFIFRGYSTPRYIATLNSGVGFFKNKLRVQTMFDYRGGNKWFNDTERLRCQRPNCEGRNDPKAAFELQAANIARLEMPIASLDGYFMKGAFVRLREASATYNFAPNWAQRLAKAKSMSMILTGRNLALWTNYLGTDPETAFNLTGGSDVPADFQTIAPPSYFVLRFNLGY